MVISPIEVWSVACVAFMVGLLVLVVVELAVPVCVCTGVVEETSPIEPSDVLDAVSLEVPPFAKLKKSHTPPITTTKTATIVAISLPMQE